MLYRELIAMIADRLQPELKAYEMAVQYAWWLLEKVTMTSRLQLVAQREITLTEQQHAHLEQLIQAIVVEHKPLGYILQEVPFGDLMISVRPPVLIPRMETEEWVVDLIQHIKKAGITDFKLLDLCSGSGCIALLFASEFKQATIYAVDLYPDALALMRENKERLGLQNMHIVQSDLFASLPNQRFDIIVSNPPYITHAEYADLDTSVTAWEDKNALVADDEGLAIIASLVQNAPNYLQHNPCIKDAKIPQLAIEIGYAQGQAVRNCMERAGFVHVAVQQDSAGKDRVVVGSLPDVAKGKKA